MEKLEQMEKAIDCKMEVVDDYAMSSNNITLEDRAHFNRKILNIEIKLIKYYIHCGIVGVRDIRRFANIIKRIDNINFKNFTSGERVMLIESIMKEVGIR